MSIQLVGARTVEEAPQTHDGQPEEAPLTVQVQRCLTDSPRKPLGRQYQTKPRQCMTDPQRCSRETPGPNIQSYPYAKITKAERSIRGTYTDPTSGTALSDVEWPSCPPRPIILLDHCSKMGLGLMGTLVYESQSYTWRNLASLITRYSITINRVSGQQ